MNERTHACVTQLVKQSSAFRATLDRPAAYDAQLRAQRAIVLHYALATCATEACRIKPLLQKALGNVRVSYPNTSSTLTTYLL